MTLDWICLKGNHLPKSVLTPYFTPCPVRSTCSTCLFPGLQLAQTAAGYCKCGPGHDSSKVSFWLIVPEDMQPSHWQILSAAAMLRERILHLAPWWLILCCGIEWELPWSSISKSHADQLHNTWTLPAYREPSSPPVIDILSEIAFTLSRIQFKFHSIEKKKKKDSHGLIIVCTLNYISLFTFSEDQWDF